MNWKNPLLILVVILALAIGVSILLTKRPVTKGPAPTPAEVTQTAEPTTKPTIPPQSAEPTEEIDLAASERLSHEEAVEIIENFRDRIDEATSVVVRIRYTLSHRLKDRQIEGEIRFDSLKPDHLRVETISLQPEQAGKFQGDWTFQKIAGTLVSATGMRKIEYPGHRIYDYLFDTTAEEMVQYTEAFRRMAERERANPLQDLLHNAPFEDRMREIIRATLVRSSKGDEIQIVSRMPRPMVEVFQGVRLRQVFPHLGPNFGADVALRTDIYDPETKVLKETRYANIEKKDLVIQTYTTLELNTAIPSDRFELELPTPGDVLVINETLEKKIKNGMKREPMDRSPLPADATEEEAYLEEVFPR